MCTVDKPEIIQELRVEIIRYISGIEPQLFHSVIVAEPMPRSPFRLYFLPYMIVHTNIMKIKRNCNNLVDNLCFIKGIIFM